MTVKQGEAGSVYERILYQAISDDRLPLPELNIYFHPTRHWQFDLAWRAYRLALEIDGAVWTRGRHARGSGIIQDMEKLNEAQLMGWCVLRIAPEAIGNGQALTLIRRALEVKGWRG